MPIRRHSPLAVLTSVSSIAVASSVACSSIPGTDEASSTGSPEQMAGATAGLPNVDSSPTSATMGVQATSMSGGHATQGTSVTGGSGGTGSQSEVGTSGSGTSASSGDTTDATTGTSGGTDSTCDELPDTGDGDDVEGDALQLATEIVDSFTQGPLDHRRCYNFALECGVVYTLDLWNVNSSAGSSQNHLHYDIRGVRGTQLIDPATVDEGVAVNRSFSSPHPDIAILCIEAGDAEAFQQFELRVDPPTSDPPTQDAVTLEPNGSPATAYPFVLQSVVESEIAEHARDHGDCHAVDIQADAIYTLGIENLESNASSNFNHVDAEVTASDGTRLVDPHAVDVARASHPTFSSKQATRATVCVRAPSQTSAYAYRFQVHPDFEHGLIQPPPAFEPNDNVHLARPIVTKTVYTSDFDISPLDASDCYRLPVSKGIEYSIGLTNLSSTANSNWNHLDYWVSTRAGHPLVEPHAIDEARSRHHTFNLDTLDDEDADLAFVCLSTPDPREAYEYRLRVDEDWRHDDPWDPTTLEPNDTWATAVALELGTWVHTGFETDTIDQHDCFRFDAQANHRYTIGLVNRTSTANSNWNHLDVDVHGRDGSALLEPRGVDENVAKYFVLDRVSNTDQTAYLCVHAPAHEQDYGYELRVDAEDRHVPNEKEPNDTPPISDPIVLDVPVSARIEADIADTADCYRFPMAGGTDYELTFATLSSTAGSHVRHLDVRVTDEADQVIHPTTAVGSTPVQLQLNNTADTTAFICAIAPDIRARYDYEFQITKN